MTKRAIKTIIVDDESLARERMRQVLSQHEDIDILDSCRNGEEAIESIQSHNPDLVFLDIEMPYKDGFEVIAHLKDHKLPLIVFVTAFSKYAVKAFEVNAYDYIHKPISDERVAVILDKTRNYLSIIYSDHERDEIFDSSQNASDRYVLKSGKTVKIVHQDEIEWIEASGNYIKIMHEDKKYMVRSTLTGFLEHLHKEKFYQIHKSTIINLDFVDSFEEQLYGDYKVIMKNGEELRMSRSYNNFLKKMAKSSFEK